MRIHLLLIPLVLMTCLACGGGDSTNPPAEQASAPQATEEAAEPATPEEGQNPEREGYLRENIVAMAEEQFPDDTGLEWEVHGFDHQEHLTFVEVEPQPSTVGYPRFRFAVSFADEAAPKVVATYALIEERFALFSTDPDLEDELLKELPQ